MAPLKYLAALALLGPGAPLEAAAADPWAAPIREASRRFAIPQSWIRRVITVESGGRSKRHGAPVVSPAGAMGLMQLMPGTWAELRLAHRLGADPFDPHDNIIAGTAYLRAMYDRFGYPGLFAAYNAGPARYAQYRSAGRSLPRETKDYLARILLRGNEAAAAPPGAVDQPLSAIFAIDRSERPARAMVKAGAVSLFAGVSAAGRSE